MSKKVRAVVSSVKRSICRLKSSSRADICLPKPFTTVPSWNADAPTLRIDKSAYGKKEERYTHNVLAAAKEEPHIKRLVADLTSAGFFLTDHDALLGISTFTKLSDYEQFLQHFHNSNVKQWNGTFYTLEEPLAAASMKEGDPARLIVVFSSIADLPLNASIARRSFFKNWPSVQKFTPQNTYVLRIADIGGTLGSFYLNSHFDPNFEAKVQALIAHIAQDRGIPSRSVVLYGGSKGGTAALYHGMKGGWHAVAVAPIVSDVYYVDECHDLHFVEGTAPLRKEQSFAALDGEGLVPGHIHVITSPQSQQYPYVSSFTERFDAIRTYTFTNPLIKNHVTVSQNTLVFVTTQINDIFYGIETPPSQTFLF